jgi:hypothetical protein
MVIWYSFGKLRQEKSGNCASIFKKIFPRHSIFQGRFENEKQSLENGFNSL